MEHNTMEIVSAAYTVYSLLNPADRLTISIDSFTEAYRVNLAMMENNSGMNQNHVGGGRLTEQKAEDTLQRGLPEAEKTLDNKQELSSLLEKLKQKMKTMPMVGNVLSNVPTMFKLLNSYLKGEYTDIPRKQLVIIVSALSYLIAPIDLIPDFIPVVGLVDDMAIVSGCIKLTKGELEKYLAWSEKNGLTEASEETEG